MAYAFITKIKDVEKHSNADKLLVGKCFGNQVIVGLNTIEGELGVYFPTDTQLGEKYAEINDLVRKKDKEGKEVGGYLDPKKRNIRALKLRKEISDGLFMPIASLATFTDIVSLKVGDSVDILNKVIIAQKYVPYKIQSQIQAGEGKNSKKIEPRVKYPMFMQHTDTKQFAYCKNEFKQGDLITISLKMHGTSQRTSNSLQRTYTKPTLLNKILLKLNIIKPFTQKYGVVTGTRRVVLSNFNGGYYGSDEFREKYHNDLENKLYKGETIYYELVGYTGNGEQTIMSKCSNDKVGDKKFKKQYGKETIFSYGCNIGENDMYTYRMTMTNEDGEVVEYPTSLAEARCEEMGIKHVPVFTSFVFTTIEDLEERVAEYVDGVDPIGKTHVREGVVVRIENRKKFKALKHKNFYFKVLEGLIKDAGVLDMEEVENLK